MVAATLWNSESKLTKPAFGRVQGAKLEALAGSATARWKARRPASSEISYQESI